jgi:electron transport complex protein RnfB
LRAVNLLAERINAALPQTQCTRCGYPDCAAYAQAISSTKAEINQCPPGGAEGIQRLAAITGRPPLLLNPDNGREGPRHLAVIDEAWCIGCTLCLDACPTDAIVGSNKLMHTVIEPYCTGCELCIPVCPVDCISLDNVSAGKTGWDAWSEAEARQALHRYEFHSLRRSTGGGSSPKTLEKPGTPAEPAAAPGDAPEAERKQAMIAAALARARSLRNKP